ncbi:MAG: hypothetical protein PVI43_01090 [Candidatus Bathyarchaeota archaeon]|jgi:hypothetical protein
MDFVPVPKEIPVTAEAAIDITEQLKRDIVGAMFYDNITLTVTRGADSITLPLHAYEPTRFGRDWETITSDKNTTMVYGVKDNVSIY